jgi:hypothetical protein
VCLNRFIRFGMRLNDASEFLFTPASIIKRTRDETRIELRGDAACNRIAELEPATAVNEGFGVGLIGRCSYAERSE